MDGDSHVPKAFANGVKAAIAGIVTIGQTKRWSIV